MRKASVFVHSYQRKPFHMNGAYVEDPKRTDQHWRDLVEGTTKDITQGLDREKASRNQMNQAIADAKKTSQLQLKQALKEKNLEKIDDLKQQKMLIDAEADKLSAETKKVQQYQDLRDQMGRHLYARDSPLSREMGRLSRRRELEKVQGDIQLERIKTKQAIEDLIRSRANTMISLETMQQAGEKIRIEEAKQQLEASKTPARLPGTSVLSKLFQTAKPSEKLMEAGMQMANQPDLSKLSSKELMKSMLAGRITMQQYLRFSGKKKAPKEAVPKAVKEPKAKKDYTVKFIKPHGMMRARKSEIAPRPGSEEALMKPVNEAAERLQKAAQEAAKPLTDYMTESGNGETRARASAKKMRQEMNE